MGYKIIYVVVLVILFVVFYLGLASYFRKCYKGRLIETIIAVLIIVGWIAVIGLFTMLYNHFFHIF